MLVPGNRRAKAIERGTRVPVRTEKDCPLVVVDSGNHVAAACQMDRDLGADESTRAGNENFSMPHQTMIIASESLTRHSGGDRAPACCIASVSNRAEIVKEP